MIKYLKLMVVMMITAFATSAMAFTPPPSPKPAGNIVDQAGALTPQELGRLNSQLRQINSNSANEIGVLIVRSLDGENIRDVGYQTAKAWGVGKRDLDNGVMIVWSPGDRKIGIETGKGVEGDLPDLKCNDIIRHTMGPEFRAHHYEAGLSHAFVAISSAIADHRAALAERDKQNATNAPSNAVAGSSTAQTSTTNHSHGGCDVAGAPMTHAGLGSGFVFLLIALGGVWLMLRYLVRNQKRRIDQQEAELKLLRQQRIKELERREQDRVVKLVAPTIVVPPTKPTAAVRPVVPATATVSATTPTANVAVRIQQEQREEQERQASLRQLELERQARADEEVRQDRLRRLEAERRQREQQQEDDFDDAVATLATIATTAAVVSSLDDDDDDDSSSSYSNDSDSSWSSDDSSSDSSDSDFGGGDFGGGGSDDDY